MKLKFLKTTFATACVVAAGMGCFKAYNASNQSESSMLLAENVEALSSGDGDSGGTLLKCYTSFVYEAGSSVVDCSTCKTREDQSDAWYNIHDKCWALE